jgi:hypothetical protein
MDTITTIIRSENPEAFFISEAEVTPMNAAWFNIDGYTLITSQTICYGKSRLACFLSIESEFRPVTLTGRDVEFISLESSTELITGVYRPFKLLEQQTRKMADDAFVEALGLVCATEKHVYIGGDFNINLKKSNHETNRLKQWQEEFALHQLISSNTWSRVHTFADGRVEFRKSLIDHLYTSNQFCKVKIEDRWSSDHNVISLTLPEREKILRKKCVVRSWRNYNITNIQAAVSAKARDVNFDQDCPEIMNAQITVVFKEALDELCPQRVVRTSRDSDIVSDTIERIKKKRKRKMHQFNKTKESYLLAEIQNLDRKLKVQIKAVRKVIIRTKIQSGNPKSFWSTVSQLQGDSKSRNRETISLLNGDLEVSDSSIVSNLFAKHFVSKVNKLSDNMGPYNWVRSEENLVISKEEVEVAIKSLKRKLCTGHDGVPLKVVWQRRIFREHGKKQL